MSTDIRGLKCSACGYRFDHATSAGRIDIVPDDGSISICIMCASIQVFTVHGGIVGLRKPTGEELAEIAKSAYVQKAVCIVRRLRGIG